MWGTTWRRRIPTSPPPPTRPPVEVVSYGSKLAAAHFSSSSGGFTTNSAWSDTGAPGVRGRKTDPWSLTAPPTNPGYAWTVTVSPTTLAADLASKLNVGTITQVDVIERDVADPAAHARYLKVTGSTGSATISARTFKSLVGLKSTLILRIVKDGSLNRYQQNDANIVYAGTWTVGSATAASGGSHRYSNSAGSCTVSFNGTYLAWLAKRSPSYGLARLTLDGVDQGTVDLYNAPPSTARSGRPGRWPTARTPSRSTGPAPRTLWPPPPTSPWTPSTSPATSCRRPRLNLYQAERLPPALQWHLDRRLRNGGVRRQPSLQQ